MRVLSTDLIQCAGCRRHCPCSLGKLGLHRVISARERAIDDGWVMEELLNVCGGWGSNSCGNRPGRLLGPAYVTGGT